MSDTLGNPSDSGDILDQIVNFAHGDTEGANDTGHAASEDPWEALGFAVGQPTDPVAGESNTGEQPGEGAAGEQGGEDGADHGIDDPKSYRYFQSKYDKAQAQMEQVMRQNELLQQALLSQSSPAGAVNPMTGAGGARYQESTPGLQMPIKPEKPADFDRIEAQTDPDSASFKYLQAMDSYRDAMDEFLLARHEQQEQAARMAQAQAAEQAQRQAYRHQLKHTFGLDDARVERFFKVMDDPNILTLDNMVALFEIVEGNKPAARQPRKPATPTIPVPPVPSSSGTGQARQPVKSQADRVFEDLLGVANSGDFSL